MWTPIFSSYEVLNYTCEEFTLGLTLWNRNTILSQGLPKEHAPCKACLSRDTGVAAPGAEMLKEKDCN